MIIAVNTRMLRLNKMEGIGYFTYESFKRITQQHPEHEFIFIFDRPYDNSFLFADNVKPVIISPAARHPVLWVIWYEWSLARLLKKTKPNLFVSTDGFLSLTSKVKSLAVIHDINFEHYPGDLPFIYRFYYRFFFPRFAKKAHRIASVSEFSKNDIASTYSLPENKIDIVYNGASEGFIPISDDLKKTIRDKYSDGKEYFLFIGTLHQRKNIAKLLKAFDLYKKMTGKDFVLVLAGTKRWWTNDMQSAFSEMEHQKDVIFTGRIPDQELYLLTASAFALTYVSLFEGFGIPIVEAFRCGVPVICSNTTSMPEIAADAALLVNPFNVEDISKAMIELTENEKLRQSLIEKGLQRKDAFSWQKTADDLWNSMMKCSSN
ncbi:MAG TPA: glycosyltransferase family 1 protein [Bacteroidia bacterium]|nr:glycosyltransferase family 1 protein [Bacteroidia bacterium]